MTMQAPGAFQNVHDCVFNNPQFLNTTTDDSFMKEFAAYTIRGAELDSSARDPPPRCHPGTRKGIIDGMHLWFRDPCRTKRMLWLVSPAGVGKSAIMQTVAEVECRMSIIAALFFSAPNGRNDPSKVITTLAYQLAARYPPYLHYIRTKIMADPKVLEKSIKGQFVELIVKPFVAGQLYHGTSSILIFIDGLDECDGRDEQILFLALISFFTTNYPNTPLLWVIASRPEDHITHYLSRRQLVSYVDKTEVSADSTEACRDVEHFLRSEFTKIRSSNSVMTLYSNWPPENLLLDLFAAALGHFAYADTAIRFIRGGNPVTRFQLIINLIERPTLYQSDVNGSQPMARLDALYGYIVSQIAPDDLPHTKEVLSHLLFPPGLDSKCISFMCDWLGMTPDTMYSALRELHSVLEIPPPNKPIEMIKFHHKSFADSLLRMKIPGLPIDRCDADKRHTSRMIHILNCIPICNSRTAPEIPWSLFSWTYSNSEEFERAEVAFSEAFRGCIARSGIPLSQPVSTSVIHASRVAAAFSWSPFGLDFAFLSGVFDDTSTLARHLREDGSLLDIPVGFLDIGCILDETVLVFFYDGSSVFDETRDFFLCIRNAILEMPGTPVKAFIANRLQGWIDVTTVCLRSGSLLGSRIYGRNLSEASRILYEYDFSTIYATVMGGVSGE